MCEGYSKSDWTSVGQLVELSRNFFNYGLIVESTIRSELTLVETIELKVRMN